MWSSCELASASEMMPRCRIALLVTAREDWVHWQHLLAYLQHVVKALEKL
jgi:hypothetical protein